MRTVAFDLDGTLLRNTTVAIVLAERDGRAAEPATLEARYRRGEIGSGSSPTRRRAGPRARRSPRRGTCCGFHAASGTEIAVAAA